MNKNIFVLKKEYEYMLEKLYKENRICLKEVDTINNYVMTLQKIYNKVIEYIEDNYLFDIEYHEDGDFNRVSCKQQKTDLLNILKGEENE